MSPLGLTEKWRKFRGQSRHPLPWQRRDSRGDLGGWTAWVATSPSASLGLAPSLGTSVRLGLGLVIGATRPWSRQDQAREAKGNRQPRVDAPAAPGTAAGLTTQPCPSNPPIFRLCRHDWSPLVLLVDARAVLVLVLALALHPYHGPSDHDKSVIGRRPGASTFIWSCGIFGLDNRDQAPILST